MELFNDQSYKLSEHNLLPRRGSELKRKFEARCGRQVIPARTQVDQPGEWSITTNEKHAAKPIDQSEEAGVGPASPWSGASTPVRIQYVMSAI